MSIRHAVRRLRHSVLGLSRREREEAAQIGRDVELTVAARWTIRYVDQVLRTIHAVDAMESLPWRRSTIDDLGELLSVRSAAVCLLRDLSLGKPAHPALIAGLLADADVRDYLTSLDLAI